MKVRKDIASCLFGRAKCGILITARLVPFSLRVTNCVFWFMKTFVLAGGYELFCGAYCLHFRSSCTSTLRRWRCFPQKFRNHRCCNPGYNLSIKLTTAYNYLDEFRHFN